MRRLLLLSLILIVYGSLYPWHFDRVPLSQGPLRTLLNNWPERLDYAEFIDILVNVLLYIPVGLFGLPAFSRWFRGGPAFAVTMLLGFSVSFAMEYCQLYLLTRDPTVSDIIVNTAGTAIGCVLAWAISHHRAPAWMELGLARADVVMLLGAWTAYEMFPFAPGHTAWLAAHWSLGLDGNWFVRALIVFAETLVVARLFRDLTGRLGVAFAAFQAVVLLRLVVASRTLSAVELGATTAGVVVALAWPAMPGLTLLFASAILVRGLTPWVIGGPQKFQWMPFVSLIDYDWSAAVPILALKLFRYGALAWLLNASGWGWVKSAACAAAFLGVIEIVQRYLPAHNAEITDPLMAIIMAFALASIRSAYGALKTRGA